MKKLLFITSLVAVSLLYAEEVTQDIVEPNKAEQTPVQKPKKESMTNLLNKAKKELKKKNPSAIVYSATASIDVGPDDAQYYDYLVMAYSQAVLTLKANMILSKTGEIAAKETLSYFHKTMPDEQLQNEMKQKVDQKIAQMKQDEMNADKIFDFIGDLISQFSDKMPPEKKDKKFETETKQNIFKNAYTQGFTKTGFDEISGLIPYDTFIVHNEDGYQIGVLAYTTPKSLQLARDLAQKNPSKATHNKNQCKSYETIVEEMEDEDLLSHLGIKYFYNENCHPALLAYGMDSFIKQEGLNADLSSESEERARGRADVLISSFLSSNVSAFLQDNAIKSKTIDAMMKASSQGENTSYNASKKNSVSLIKEMSKEFASSTQMSLRGLEDARVWDVDNENSRVVGVIRYYSMDSIEAANKQFDPNYGKTKTKNSAPTQPSVKHSTNLDVDDF